MENKRVLLGMSGGVDSAVAAYLLKEEGHEVIGAFMRNWDAYTNNDFLGNPTIGDDICPQEKDYNDAKAVADKLGIPLLRVDFVQEYWDHVFTYFLEEYKNGRTPNPDILCNKYIKFDAFLKFAKEQGADYIATGHYARVKHNEDGTSVMLRGVDYNKDQTYFLCQLNQYMLNNSLFPIGHLTKPEVRQIAKDLELPVAEKKDSTGICFIGERNFQKFLSNYLPAKPGNIVDIRNNEVVGKHDGVMYYTLGQRKGLGIGGLKNHATSSWFVVDKSIEKRELYVVQGEESDYLYSSKTIVKDVNWISNEYFEGYKELSVKYRYRQKDIKANVRFIDKNTIEVINIDKAKATTPGQECVFYDGEVCLGGGTISEVIK